MGKRVRPDILVVSDSPLDQSVRSKIRRIDGVDAVADLALASVSFAGRAITVAAVDVPSFRRFAPTETAESNTVWQVVANGDAVVTHELGRALRKPLGATLPIGRQADLLPLRIGAYARTVPTVDMVVNIDRGAAIGVPPRNALLLSVDQPNLDRALAAIHGIVKYRAGVQPLRTEASRNSGQETMLTGLALGKALGSFRYRAHPDGTVAPEPRWIAENIRTESVPILGRVTCHRVMLPQLRGALTEIVRSGLAGEIDSDDYGGCYVPRFIEHNPSRGLSLHTWGIAIDLNVATNQRGTQGQIDRRVVNIFKAWGFAWGGHWTWTDPMHFELAAITLP